MKLERYKDKKETRKKVILINLTVITLIGVTMVLYKTFANFRTSTSFQIMSGKVIYKKKMLDFGTDIPLEENSDGGLYEVTHTGPDGWTNKEYRYAGKNPNNYIYFNCSDVKNQNENTCEKWRIIGLVNIKTSSNKIEQRIKIVNPASFQEPWDQYGKNDWAKSSLMKYLNSDYYNSLEESAKDMIEKEISWTLGGSNTANMSAEQMYQKERGTTVYNGNATEWNINTVKDPVSGSLEKGLFKGIGILYASDYGFAFGGTDSRAKNCQNYLGPHSSESGAGAFCKDLNFIRIIGCSTFLTHDTRYQSGVWMINSWNYDDYLYSLGGSDTGTSNFYNTRTSVCISNKFNIVDGVGSENEPYVLG